MDNNYDNLKSLIERIKTINFIERLFLWKNVRQQLINAVADLQKMSSNISFLLETNTELKSSIYGLSKDLDLSKEALVKKINDYDNCQQAIKDKDIKISQLVAEIASKDTSIENFNDKIQKFELENQSYQRTSASLQNERDALKEENTRLITTEESRRVKHDKDIATLNSVSDRIEKERKAEVEAMANDQFEKLKNQKETWSKHQTNVRSNIKTICQKHIVEFVDKIPFKGEPDNTLKICGEFVIFDAKSPAGDDLSNFPNYLKDQAERAKKYAKQEDVKKDIFFVVPSNTLESLNQYVFNLGDYDVYVISVDSLEQIVLSLKKIESYEFAENLSPEERESICRVIGKFAHLTKRRIQIDSFFAKRFLEIAYQSEADLPSDILAKVIEFEKSEKINPPQEKRVKAISTKDLIKDTNKLNSEVASKGILIDDIKISGMIDDLQLYKNDLEE